MSLPVDVCMPWCADAQKGQKRVSDPLELDSQAVVRHPMWVLGMELKFSEQ